MDQTSFREVWGPLQLLILSDSLKVPSLLVTSEGPSSTGTWSRSPVHPKSVHFFPPFPYLRFHYRSRFHTLVSPRGPYVTNLGDEDLCVIEDLTLGEEDLTQYPNVLPHPVLWVRVD